MESDALDILKFELFGVPRRGKVNFMSHQVDPSLSLRSKLSEKAELRTTQHPRALQAPSASVPLIPRNIELLTY